MTSYTPDRILAVAREAAAKAAHIITAHRKDKTFHVHEKGERNFVTTADLEADKAIVETIKSYFPQHQILSEEQFPHLAVGENPSEPLWVIDPIDGTTNYLYGLAHVGISIALFHAGHVQVGLVHAPFLSEEFSAIRGHGAYLNGERIYARPTNGGLKGALIATGFPYKRDTVPELTTQLGSILSHCQDLRRFGACSLDLCCVASGRLDGYYETVAPWDMAAGALIAREAGALVGNYKRSGQTSRSYLTNTETPALPQELDGDSILVATKEIFSPLRELLIRK